MGIAEIRGEKNGGGVVGVPDCLGQTNYAEICILVTKYISKVSKIENTWHVFNYVFQILVFQLLDNSACKHAEQPRFLSCSYQRLMHCS